MSTGMSDHSFNSGTICFKVWLVRAMLGTCFFNLLVAFEGKVQSPFIWQQCQDKPTCGVYNYDLGDNGLPSRLQSDAMVSSCVNCSSI